MGYTRSRLIKLVFSDPDLATDYTGQALVVKMRPMSVADFRVVTSMAYLADVDPDAYTPDDATKADEILSLFASRLASWNVEDEAEDGTRTPVPATLAGVETQELGFVLAITKEWMRVCVAVSADLKAPSPGGAQSPEGSTPPPVLSIASPPS